MILATSEWLTNAAVTAGAVTTILGCGAVVARLAMRWKLVRRFFSWVREGWLEDRAEQLDKTLAFNGTGSFRSDMRAFYLSVTAFMEESRHDRQGLHDENEELGRQFHDEIARTKLADSGEVNDRDDADEETP